MLGSHLTSPHLTSPHNPRVLFLLSVPFSTLIPICSIIPYVNPATLSEGPSLPSHQELRGEEDSEGRERTGGCGEWKVAGRVFDSKVMVDSRGA